MCIMHAHVARRPHPCADEAQPRLELCFVMMLRLLVLIIVPLVTMQLHCASQLSYRMPLQLRDRIRGGPASAGLSQCEGVARKP